MSTKLLVIDPSIVYPEDDGVATILSGWSGEADVRQPALRPGDGPAPGFGYDVSGVVLMGSKASADDDYPWLRELSRWLDPLLDGSRPIPLLGICFGHQLVAQRAGGTLGKVHDHGGHVLGMMPSMLDGGRLLPGRRELRVVASHCEEVKALPTGYRVTARRETIHVDGFEHERLPLFGFQFHPEARGDFLSSRQTGLPCVDAVAAADGERVIEAFFELVRTHAQVEEPRGR